LAENVAFVSLFGIYFFFADVKKNFAYWFRFDPDTAKFRSGCFWTIV